MLEEEKKHWWLRVIAIMIIAFIAAFLAFYAAMETMFHRMTDPAYQAKRIEKMIQKEEKKFDNFENKLAENPFEPKMRPMLVNLVKENNEYKVIVDLRPLNGQESAVNVNVDGDELTVAGAVDKKIRGSENIISFTQSYVLDEEMDSSKIVKEKKGDKYIITIPFKQ